MVKKDVARARAMVRERIDVAQLAHAQCDALIAAELAVLAGRGVVPTCSKGCAHCCRQEIVTPRAEGEAAVEWIKASWAPDQIEALVARIRAWLIWYRTDYPRHAARGLDGPVAVYEHGPVCPALQDGACSIYEVRPLTCRTHLVSSSPDACRQERDPQFRSSPAPQPLLSIPRVTQPASLRIRGAVEHQGSDFLASVHRLPEWLAHLLEVEDQPWLQCPPLFARGWRGPS